MERLINAELDIKIHRFLEARFANHPELANAKNPQSKAGERHATKFKSTVKRLTSLHYKTRPVLQH